MPEDLLSILSDSNLFASGADVTTKDILKRYGDIASKVPQGGPAAATSPPRSRDGRNPTTPIFHRVDTDPSQAVAWQREASVRHVPGPPQPQQAPLNPNLHPSANNVNRAHGRGVSSSAQPGDARQGDNGAADQNGHSGHSGYEDSHRNGNGQWGGRPPNPQPSSVGVP